MNKQTLKKLIIRSLKKQGFRIKGPKIHPPKKLDKERLRNLHSIAVQHRIEKSKNGLARYEDRLLNHFASGSQVDPNQVSPKLVEVHAHSNDELLFRYASLHWSIPVSSGYGRRLRFLVVDEQNDKLIGLFGLGDPIFNLGPRDRWIGWDSCTRNSNLHHILDAFVLGAVPPYSFLLCGKLVAMLAASDEVRAAFKKKYSGCSSLIQSKTLDARVALITTTSALGRSSVYNRIKYANRLLYNSVGFTQGSGEFHFSNGLYGAISNYAARYCEPTAKQENWGTGFRNRREVVKKCLPKLDLSTEWLYHGIRREIFLVPLARNTREFLTGAHSRLLWFNQSANDMAAFFKMRWLIPRSQWDNRYTLWKPDEWRLWPNSATGQLETD